MEAIQRVRKAEPELYAIYCTDYLTHHCPGGRCGPRLNLRKLIKTAWRHILRMVTVYVYHTTVKYDNDSLTNSADVSKQRQSGDQAPHNSCQQSIVDNGKIHYSSRAAIFLVFLNDSET